MLNLIAIDDEPFALKVLEDHCGKIDFVSLQKTFTNPLEGLDYLKANPATGLFLDIKMHDISGLELSRMIPTGCHIIFTTAFPEYAVDGFEINAVDYLLKPISFSRLLQSCHRLQNLVDATQPDQPILIKDGNELVRLKTSDIQFAESSGNYVKVYTSKGIFLHRQPIKEFIDELPKKNFIRTHKSYVINLEHVTRIETFQLSINDQKIPLSPNYREDAWIKLGITNKFR